MLTREPTGQLDVTIYCRVSLDRNGEMLAVDRQEAECREYCVRRGWTVREVLVDNDISATSGKRRPAFETLLKSHPEAIVVWHTDRLVRLTKELERVIDLGVMVYAVHAGDLDLSHPAGVAVAKTITTWAEYEVRQKGLRQRSAHVQRAKSGKSWWTKRPFGYNPDGTLLESESALVAQAYLDFVSGKATLTEIARSWTARGFTTSEGNQWDGPKMRQFLLNARNAGIRTQRGAEVCQGNWTPIVSDELYRAACVILADPRRHRGGGGRAKGLLVGVAVCGKCGSTVRQGANRRRSDGFYPRMYVCSQGSCTSHPVEEVDAYVREILTAVLRDPQYSVVAPNELNEVATSDLLQEREALTVRMRELGEDYADGLVDRTEFRRLRQGQQQDLAALDEKLHQAFRSETDVSLPTLAYIAENWDNLSKVTLTEKREALAGLFSIRLLQRSKGTREYDPTKFVEIAYA